MSQPSQGDHQQQQQLPINQQQQRQQQQHQQQQQYHPLYHSSGIMPSSLGSPLRPKTDLPHSASIQVGPSSTSYARPGLVKPPPLLPPNGVLTMQQPSGATRPYETYTLPPISRMAQPPSHSSTIPTAPRPMVPMPISTRPPTLPSVPLNASSPSLIKTANAPSAQQRPYMPQASSAASPSASVPPYSDNSTTPPPPPPPQGLSLPKTRIDPRILPKVVKKINEDMYYFAKHPYKTRSQELPPYACTPCVAVDEGISRPRHLRSSLYSLPKQSDWIRKYEIPFGVILQPMAVIPPNEDPMPLFLDGVAVDGCSYDPPVTAASPPRCFHCMAYVNPFVQFIEGGMHYLCSFCQSQNEVPLEYRQSFGSSPHPVFQYGSVDFVASKEFCQRPPSSGVIYFCVDVSPLAMQHGAVESCMLAIQQCVQWMLSSPQQYANVKVILMTYDATAVYFYRFNSVQSLPEMMVCSDLFDVVCPSPDLLIDLTECASHLMNFLSILPQWHMKMRRTLNTSHFSSFGALVDALIACATLFKTGGRCFIFQSTCLQNGPGPVEIRDVQKYYHTDKENQLWIPQNAYYVDKGNHLTSVGLSVNLFYLPQSQYSEIGTLGAVSRHSGGDLFYYPMFDGKRDGERLVYDALASIQRVFVFDVLIRTRTTPSSLRVSASLGDAAPRVASNMDLEMGGLDSRKTCAFLLDYQKVEANKGALLQVAMVYTTLQGQRRLRLFHMSFSHSATAADFFKGMDLDCMMSLMLKQTFYSPLDIQMPLMKERLGRRLGNILLLYRKCAATSSYPQGSQLILPDTLKLMPVYMLGWLKHRVMKVRDVVPDERVALMRWRMSGSMHDESHFFYPCLMRVDRDFEMDSKEQQLPSAREGVQGEVIEEEERDRKDYGMLESWVRQAVGYRRLSLSYVNVAESGVYLLDDSVALYLFVGKSAPKEYLADVFGVQGIEGLDAAMKTSMMSSLPRLSTKASEYLRGMIDKLRQFHGKCLPIVVIKQKDPGELRFYSHMIEDRSADCPAHPDYLVELHYYIQSKLET